MMNKKESAEHKQVKEILRCSNELYKHLFENSPVSIVLIGIDGRILDINPYHIRHVAGNLVNREDYIGKNVLLHPSVVNAGLTDYYVKLLEGIPFDLKEVYFPILTNGRDGYFNVRGVPVFKENKIVGAIAIHEEITEQKKREEKLRKRDKKLVEAKKMMEIMAANLEKNKEETEKKIALTISSRILPIMEDLQKDENLKSRKNDLDVLTVHLKDLTSILTERKKTFEFFSVTESQIATMIITGLTSKEISNQLNVSMNTIKTHRKHLRQKLCIKGKRIDLATYLKSETELKN